MGSRMWVVDMEKKLSDAETLAKVSKWAKHCIFLVPPRFKRMMVDGRRDSTMYKPQTVALGPFHHGNEGLKPMEEHKMRAVRHLLHRADKTIGELVESVEVVADELEDAYMDLGDEWRGENRGKFLEMMIADGCFLLEVMRKGDRNDYLDSDPVFSKNGMQHIRPFVQRDMLMLENQLPLKVLQRIVAMETGKPPNDGDVDINKMVLTFLCPNWDPLVPCDGLGLHPLDLFRRSLLKCSAAPVHRGAPGTARPEPERVERDVPRSAQKLADAGIRFRTNSEKFQLNDIDFHRMTRRLMMPRVFLDDATPYKFHNVMAFEALHVRTSNDVTAFVLFMKDIIDSAEDVALLRRKGIVVHDLADNDEAVVKMFNTLTRDVCKYGQSRLCGVREEMEDYYKRSVMKWLVLEPWAFLKNKYFRSPWTFIALVAAICLVATDIMQTFYAVMSYEVAKQSLQAQLKDTKH